MADDQLVFVKRPRRYDWLTGSSQDLYAGDLFDDVPQSYQGAIRKWSYQRPSYTKDGFRTNSSVAPFQVAVVGDSFIEIGESDSTTFSEQLKDRTGLSVINLGHGWYGPYQYLQIIKRYTPILKPQTIVVAVFAGNDIQDIDEYEKWQRTGQYYKFGDQTRNIIYRYYAAMRDILSVIRFDVSAFVARKLPSLHRFLVATRERLSAIYSGKNNVLVSSERNDAGDELTMKLGYSLGRDTFGFVKVASQELPMAFVYWNSPQPSEQLLQTRPWQSLERIMMTVTGYEQQLNVRVIWLLIPTKLQVYGRQTRLSDEFQTRLAQQLNFEDNFSDAFHKIADHLGLEYLDLLPVFRQLAPSCILYYPTDAHWNIYGRRVAANILSTMLVKGEMKEVPIDVSDISPELCGKAAEYYN